MSNDALNVQPTQINTASGNIGVSGAAINSQPRQVDVAVGVSINVSARNFQSFQSGYATASIRIACTVNNVQIQQVDTATARNGDHIGHAANIQPSQLNVSIGYAKNPPSTAVNIQPLQIDRLSGGSIAQGNGQLGNQPKVIISPKRKEQLPPMPQTDARTRQWMEGVAQVINERLLAKDGNRSVTLNDLVAAGIAGTGAGGNIIQPIKNVTVPPKITGLSIRGAMTTIILNWNAPTFSNFGLVEIWRSDKNNIGEAFQVGTSVTNFFQDPVGTGAVKYYWVRSRSSAQIAGDFNAADGTKGQTSLDPSYVMKLLTSEQWQPNNAYLPYQYVRGIPASPDDAAFPFQNFQYVCLDGGISGTTEPIWPVIVGDTIIDGSITWQCRPLTEKVPFTIGEVDGVPCVVMSQAFIEDASINTAKIHDLAADKITAGELKVGNDIQVGSKIWGGFSDYANAAHVAGFWLGLDGGLPRFALEGPVELDEFGAPFQRHIRFNGQTFELNVDIFSGADGFFDDLTGDSVYFDRARFGLLDIDELVTSSDRVREVPYIGIGDPKYRDYLCYPNGTVKTEMFHSPVMQIGTGYSRQFAFFQTGFYSSIVPYDFADNATKYRAKSKAIGFAIKITAIGAGIVGNMGDTTYLDVYIFDGTQSLPSTSYTDHDKNRGIPNSYLAKIAVSDSIALSTAAPQTITATTKVDGSVSSAFNVDVYGSATGPASRRNAFSKRELIIACADDLEFLNYTDSNRLRIAVVYKVDYQEGESHDTDLPGDIIIEFQIDTRQTTTYSPINDRSFSLSKVSTQAFQVTDSEDAALRAMIRNFNR